jgi:hypothetical protein
LCPMIQQKIRFSDFIDSRPPDSKGRACASQGTEQF